MADKMWKGRNVMAFAKAVLHGDDEHKAWLLEAAKNFIAGKSLPAPRGKGATSADVIEGMREARPQLRETMRAEMKPDCYGGDTCDQIVPCWNVYADGDKQDDTIHEPLQLDPRGFPPGTKVIVKEPTCPECGEVRSPLFPQPEAGPLYAGPCDCGFDWDAWVLEQYS